MMKHIGHEIGGIHNLRGKEITLVYFDRTRG